MPSGAPERSGRRLLRSRSFRFAWVAVRGRGVRRRSRCVAATEGGLGVSQVPGQAVPAGAHESAGFRREDGGDRHQLGGDLTRALEEVHPRPSGLDQRKAQGNPGQHRRTACPCEYPGERDVFPAPPAGAREEPGDSERGGDGPVNGSPIRSPTVRVSGGEEGPGELGLLDALITPALDTYAPRGATTNASRLRRSTRKMTNVRSANPAPTPPYLNEWRGYPGPIPGWTASPPEPA